jgi:hypothetical protein
MMTRRSLSGIGGLLVLEDNGGTASLPAAGKASS